MNFIVKKSNELTIVEKQQICNLFFEVFEKKKTLQDFDKQFLGTFKGYSYHAIMQENDNIVGINTIIPYEYSYFGKIVTIALSVDTMTSQKHRALNSFTKMAKLVYEYAKNDGVVFVLGFPNDISYKIFKKMLRWQDIGRLNFFILPINIGNIKPLLKYFSWLSNLFANAVCKVSKFVTKDIKNITYNISKMDSQLFRLQKYDAMTIYNKNDLCEFFYKLDSFENTKVIYILDVLPMSKKALESVVENIFTQYGNNIDAILYLGKINFTPFNLIRVPIKFEPKNVYVSGLILDESVIDDRIWNIQNWNLNLSNMDVI